MLLSHFQLIQIFAILIKVKSILSFQQLSRCDRDDLISGEKNKKIRSNKKDPLDSPVGRNQTYNE